MFIYVHIYSYNHMSYHYNFALMVCWKKRTRAVWRLGRRSFGWPRLRQQDFWVSPMVISLAYLWYVKNSFRISILYVPMFSHTYLNIWCVKRKTSMSPSLIVESYAASTGYFLPTMIPQRFPALDGQNFSDVLAKLANLSISGGAIAFFGQKRRHQLWLLHHFWQQKNRIPIHHS